MELSLDFTDLPDLAGVVRGAVRGDDVEYRLDGTVGVDAGRFGQPTFGPMTLARGDVRPSLP